MSKLRTLAALSVIALFNVEIAYVFVNIAQRNLPDKVVQIAVPVPVYVVSRVPSSIKFDGYIDNNVSLIMDAWAFQVMRADPRKVTIYMSSTGGTDVASLEFGRTIRILERNGIAVRFVAVNRCFSGCFLASTFASQVYATRNSTLGFGHQSPEFSAAKWGTYVYVISSNTGWTTSYTDTMMRRVYNATQALNEGLITGIWG